MTRRARALLCGLAVAVGAGVGAGSSATAQVPVDPCQSPAQGGGQNLFIQVDGLARGLHLHVPQGAPAGRRMPLVIALHGMGGSGSGMEASTGFSALGDKDGFVVAYPDAANGKWSIHSTARRGIDDVEFIRSVIDYAETQYCIDDGRVFAVGVSNGGGEVARLACELADRLLAVASVAGQYERVPGCEPARPVSVLEIHSTSDRVVPYLGFASNKADSVPVFLSKWRRFDRCREPGSHHRVDKLTVRVTWRCTRRTVVEQYKLAGINHAWPGSTASAVQLPGPGSATVNIWNFFTALPPRA